MARTLFPAPNPVGQPRTIPTVEILNYKIDKYFESCLKRDWVEKLNPVTKEMYIEEEVKQIKPYTITGLAIALGFLSREALLYYETIDQEYLGAVKKAKMRCQGYAEEQLYRPQQVAGVIFNLKNNYGWQDKTTNEHTGLNGQPIGIETNDKRAADNLSRMMVMVDGAER